MRPGFFLYVFEQMDNHTIQTQKRINKRLHKGGACTIDLIGHLFTDAIFANAATSTPALALPQWPALSASA